MSKVSDVVSSKPMLSRFGDILVSIGAVNIDIKLGGRNMIIIAEALWPPDKSNDMGKAMLELPPLPEHITMTGPYLSNELIDGIRSITIYEFDGAKYEDASKTIMQRYVSYMKISGFTFDLKRWREAVDALELIGLG